MKKTLVYGETAPKPEHRPISPPGPAGWSCPKGWHFVDNDAVPPQYERDQRK